MFETAIVTGASSGIGRELALELARRGTSLGLLARRPEALEEVASMARSLGARAFVAPCDVRDRAGVHRAVADSERENGPTDLLIASAGIGLGVPAVRFDAAKAEEVLRVNLFGALYAIEAVLPSMLSRGRGHLAGISSLAAYKGFPESGAYSASKAALNVLLEALRVELAPRGVRVTTICPGFVRTAMTQRNSFPMPFLVGAVPAAKKILRAIERNRRVYRFPWPMALVVGILGLLPGALYDRIARGRQIVGG
jgi:short-subunit dehydrogenase